MKNYSSTVPDDRSMMLIERALVKGGATHISKAYENERVVGFYFQITIGEIQAPFKLPVRIQAVHDAFELQYVRPDKINQEALWKQAERTAWKILYDWIMVQLAMIEMEQAKPLEIFLPYALVGGTDQTLFEKFQESKFKMLTSGEHQ